jgi:outer membrane receptor protein involved in Fe transport|tara:strand:+ start:15753 stop:17804 length:2052 start_codon:yes stop_codon:yes gene_type:complete
MKLTAPTLPILFTLLSMPALSADNLETLVVTATRAEKALAEIPGNSDLIAQDTLELASHTHINESLARISGSWISRGNGQEHLTALRSPVLTGAGGCGAFLMAQDGVSLRAAGFCNINELFEANTEQAGRIEVIKGPGTALYGSNAMHGLINVISRPLQNGPHKSAQLEAGPHDYYRFKWSSGAAAYRLDFNAASDAGIKDDSGFDQQKLTLRHKHEADRYAVISTFAMTNLNQDTAGFVTGHEVYKSGGTRRDNPNPEAFRDVRSARWQSRFEVAADNDANVIITPYLRYTDMVFMQHFLPGQAVEENGHASAGIQSSWHASLSRPLDLIAGVDLEYTRAFLKEIQPNDTIHSSAFVAATIPAGTHYDYDADASVIAPFVHIGWQLTDRTELVTGLRFEYLKYDYDNNGLTGRSKDDGTDCAFGGCRFNRPDDRTDSFSNWSPKIGLTHQFSSSHHLYVLLANGFRAPQATELYRLQNDQSVSSIDSEELDSIELGFRGFMDRLNYDISFYSMKKDNFIFRDSSRINVDNGKTRHQGIEFSLQYDLSESLEVSVNASIASHEYDFDRVLSGININGNEVDTAPRYLGSTRLAWEFQPGSRAELEWVHLGEYYEDPENQNRYDGHDLLHLRIKTEFSARFSLYARLMNITNTEYAERADFGFGVDRYFVGEPISLYVGIEGHF